MSTVPKPWARLATGSLVLLLAAPFILHAGLLGWAGLWQDLWPESRFDPPGQPLSAMVFLHMVTGAAITLLVPVQLILAPKQGGARFTYRESHRWLGRLLVVLAATTAIGGLVWIAVAGTIGGLQMSGAFALYGGLMLLAASETFRHARAGRIAHHRRWALRFAVLAMASWFYRIHYTVWYIATGGAGSVPDFSGVFDRIQNFAFFLPYLALLEVWFAMERRRARAVTASSGPRPAG